MVYQKRMLQELIPLVLMVIATNGHFDCGIYTAANGKSCFMCPPGFLKISDCDDDGKSAGCMPCENGKYQATCTEATTCAECSSHCKWFFSYIKKNCSTISDLTCECQPGFFLIDQGEGNGICKRHTECPPGQGMSKPGTAVVDVRCEPCVNGATYSNISSSIEQCQKCSTCLTSLKSSCTPYNDTECYTAADHKGGPDGSSQTVIWIIIPVCVIAVVAFIVGLLIYIHKRRRTSNPGREHEAGQSSEVHGGPRISTPDLPIQNGSVSPSEELTSIDLDVDADPINPADILQHEDHIRAHTRQVVPHNQETSNCIYDSMENTYARHSFADPLISEPFSSPSNNVNDILNTDPKQIIPIGPGNISETVMQQPNRGGHCSFVKTHKEHRQAKQDEAVRSVFMFLAEYVVVEFKFFYRRLFHMSGKMHAKGPPVESWIEDARVEDNNKEIRYKLLLQWRQWYGKLDDNFFLIMKKALENSNANDIVEHLKTEFKENFPS